MRGGYVTKGTIARAKANAMGLRNKKTRDTLVRYFSQLEARRFKGSNDLLKHEHTPAPVSLKLADQTDNVRSLAESFIRGRVFGGNEAKCVELARERVAARKSK